jgi:hypothetical protein
MTATLLPIPDDPRFQVWLERWPEIEQTRARAFPRSYWLGGFEALLREFYPSANSRSLSLTARHAAPFPLRDGPNVP